MTFRKAQVVALTISMVTFLILFHHNPGWLEGSGGKQKNHERINSKFKMSFFENWPEQAFPSIHLNNRELKLNHFFNLVGIGSKVLSIPIDLLFNKELFSIMFPGYPEEMRTDKNLWDRFFIRDFDSKISSVRLSEGTRFGVSIYMPWLGCLDILKRYGADVIVFGSSIEAQAIPPDFLNSLLKKSNLTEFTDPKILMCTTPAFPMDMALDLSKEIKAILGPSKKVPWLIYGVGPNSFTIEALYYDSILATKKRLLHQYQRSESLGSLSLYNQPMLLPWSWNEIIRQRREATHLPLPLSTARKSRTIAINRWSIVNGSMSEAAFEDPVRVKEFIHENPVYSPFIEGLLDQDCNWKITAKERFHASIEAIKKISEHTLIFLSPTTRDEFIEAPSCYLPAARDLVLAENSESVHAIQGELSDWSLTYTDFTTSDLQRKDDPLKLDVSHPNIGGAMKVTKRLADLLIKLAPNHQEGQ